MRLSFLKNNRFQLLQFLDAGEPIPKYTVIWKNWDGSIIETDEGVLEGGLPAYNSPTPTKPSTQTIRYEFDGWEPAVTHVTSDAVYTAKFREVQIKYQISWLNYDGSLIKMEEVNAGTKPSYSGTPPTKPSTTQYRYEFNGWTTTIETAYADASYTAVFTELPNTVPATFTKATKDGGGTLQTVTVDYNTTPNYAAALPTTTRGNATDFTFIGWEPALGPITQNTTYVAKFQDNRPLTVQFLVRDLEEYISDGDPVLTEANVIWKNWDGDVLELDKDVPIGTTPTYNGETPTRAAVPGYTYTFAGWDKQIVPLTGFTTYTATFTEVIETHKATFVKASADGGGTLQTINAVNYGAIPVYTAATPTTTKGTAEVFPFVGWNPPLGPMTADTTYTAVFDDLRPYTVRFLDRSITEYEA